MTYDKKLPRMQSLRNVGKLIEHFPATCKQVISKARKFGADSSVITFLNQFPPDEVFESREDFLTRCEELELFINEESEMPKEFLRSSVD